ncbi:hypothetical protein [Formosa maritima]|uniref:DUF3575 domain-containing protein n=1 Tax=Formosa maritima TaxID=2592046 RepID=A0A5D0GJ61_9FLAO|nr:hypothetical protein [Formosa maritima]TYA59065.1 hypothetical protein FVF61_02640 [Formosa maritima]
MKHILLVAMLFGLSINGFSQDKEQTASVEKSVYGIQTGFAGIWAHGEFRLSNKFALRTEIGLDLGIWENNYSNEKGLFFIPVITLEPRFYYNLNKRVNKGKRIDGNSGNFIALKTSYNSDLFFIGTSKDINLETDFMIVPTWGIRRNIGNHFNYEAGFGLGYIHYREEYYNDSNSDVAVNLHARIGYKF